MNDRPNPEYLKAFFAADLPASGLPGRFGIVTAYNPESRVSAAEVNERADSELKGALVAASLPHFRVTSGAPDGSHREPGYGIVVDSPEAVRAFSRSFFQEAFFWVEDGTVYLINTGGERRHRVATWTERRLSAPENFRLTSG